MDRYEEPQTSFIIGLHRGLYLAIIMDRYSKGKSRPPYIYYSKGKSRPLSIYYSKEKKRLPYKYYSKGRKILRIYIIVRGI
jgi:hypothetical protein